MATVIEVGERDCDAAVARPIPVLVDFSASCVGILSEQQLGAFFDEHLPRDQGLA
jgi:hypothetical protein